MEAEVTTADAHEMVDGEDPGFHCQDCGFLNPSSEEFCQACNARLGAVRISAKVDAEAGTGRYRAIREKVDEVRTGRVTVEQFAVYLEELSVLMAQKARSIIDNLEAMNYGAENGEEVEMGLSGVQYFEQGIEELYDYTQDLEESHLDQGLQMMWEGTQRVMEAMRINRESRERLALLWDDLQAP